MNNKDLIKQYVDTGLKLPIHQVNYLKGGLLQTYLRKRFLSVMSSHSDLEFYEYRVMSEDNQQQYIRWVIKRHENLPVRLLHDSSDLVKEFFVDEIIRQRDYIELDNYLELSEELKLRYLKYRILDGRVSSRHFLLSLSSEGLYKYMEILVENSPKITDEDYSSLPNELKVKYLNIRISNGGVISEQQYDDMTHDMKLRYITAVKNRKLTELQLRRTPDDLALVYLNQRRSQGWGLDADEYKRFWNNKNKNEQ